jgi:hypothetical protein
MSRPAASVGARADHKTMMETALFFMGAPLIASKIPQAENQLQRQNAFFMKSSFFGRLTRFLRLG